MTSRFLPSILTLALGALLIVDGPAHAQKNPGAALPIVYEDVSAGRSRLGEQAGATYAGKLHVIKVSEKDGFTPAKLKFSNFGVGDPRGTKERETPVRVVCVFVVMPDGQTTEPRIISSTDSRISDGVITSVLHRRFIPATYRGTPVASLEATVVKWAGAEAQDYGMFQNGLGIMGYRDR